jgi:hypothetical protein
MKKRIARPFLLLELLIAFALVALCSLPLIHTPYSFLRHEIVSLEKIELSRKARSACAESLAKFYSHEIKWEELPHEANLTFPLSQPQLFKLGLKGISDRTFRLSSRFILKSHFKDQNQSEHRLGYIEVTIEPTSKKKGDKTMRYRHAVHLKTELSSKA